MVASYRISDLKIDYTFNHYIIDSHSQLVNNLTNYLATFTYQDNLDPLTVSADSRIYREYYEDVTRHHLKEFVYQFLSNSNYTNMTHDEAIDNYLEKEIKKDQKLEKVLYVYNYFKRFYSIDIDGMMLKDFLLFHAQGFDKNMNVNDITTAFLANEKNMELNATNDTYERLFAKYTKLSNITDFLAYLVQEFGHETPAEWYANQFKGYLVEFGVPDNPEIMYTLWDHLSHPDKNTGVKWYNYTLPIVTLPKNAAYVISSPTQFIIGAQRTYIAQPDDPVQQSDLQARIASYVARMKDYYTTAYRLLEDKKYFNNIHTVQIDKRYTYDENGILIFQNPYTTQEPFHKNFNEVIGQWAYNDYNAATANGAYIIWRVEGLMDGRFEDGYEYTFHTWSHETAHNIDARLFLKDNSRRFDAGGEDYADGNLTQSFGDGDIVMNLSRHLKGTTSNISANLEPGRIDSPVEIHDFYKKLFDTLYIMDYLEGRAFLKLSPKEQSKIAVQAFYPDENKYTDEKLSHINKRTTVYHEIDEATYQDMHLTEIDDLYKNQLVIFPTVIYSTYGTNRYGGENIYKVHWYQPNNPEGRPDSYSIKWFAYEMLGYKGYTK